MQLTIDPPVCKAHLLGAQAERPLYRLRNQAVEPVFAMFKRCVGWRQVSMRGWENALVEWNYVIRACNNKCLYVLRATIGKYVG